jgi:hypothetical protein
MKSFDLFRMALRRNKIAAKKDKGSIFVNINKDSDFDSFAKVIASYRVSYGSNYFPVDWKSKNYCEILNVEHGQFVERPVTADALFDMVVAPLMNKKNKAVRAPREPRVNAIDSVPYDGTNEAFTFIQDIFKHEFNIELLSNQEWREQFKSGESETMPEDGSKAYVNGISHVYNTTAYTSKEYQIRFAEGVSRIIQLYYFPNNKKNPWQMRASVSSNVKRAQTCASFRNGTDVRVRRSIAKKIECQYNTEALQNQIAKRKLDNAARALRDKLSQEAAAKIVEEKEKFDNNGIVLSRHSSHLASSNISINPIQLMKTLGEEVQLEGDAFATNAERDRVYAFILNRVLGNDKVAAINLEHKMSQFVD